ncbi:MAG: hypothetical protein V4484_10980 [Pseudomonadota bacterium]
MESQRIFTLTEVCAFLSDKTDKAWSRGDLLEQAHCLSLQVFATTPVSSRVIIRGGDRDYDAGLPASGRRLALLLAPQVKDLWLHGSATTSRPALEFGDPGYQTFTEVLAVRAKHNRAGHTRETWPYDGWDDGEFMGESDVCFFADAVQITDETCRFPLHTVEELVRHTLVAALSNAQQLSHDSPLPAVRGITKDQVLIAFGDLVTTNLAKRLSDAEGLYGDNGARVQRGTAGGRHKSLWNPVVLAVGLRDPGGIARHMLHKAFQEHAFLSGWWEEWKTVYADLP